MKKNKFLLCFIFINSLLFSQVVIHKTYTSKNGLVNNEIRQIYADSKGYIWFATNSGVSRWDGNSFQNITTSTGLTSPVVFDITEGIDGTIYFATFGGNGITTFNDGKIDTLFNKSPNKVNFVSVIHSNKDGSLLISASRGILLYQNKVLVNLNELNDIPLTSVYDKYVAENGDVYLATADGVLLYENGNLKSIVDKTLLSDPFFVTIGGNKKGEIFFGGKNKIYRLINGKVKILKTNIKILNSDIFDITFAKNGVGYFGTDLGLAIFENNKFKLINSSNGLLSNKVWKVYEHQNGNIFLTDVESGFQIYKPKLLENFYSLYNQSSSNIYNYFTTKSGKEIINSSDGLIIKTGSHKLIFNNDKYPQFKHPLAILERKNGNIVIGSRKGIQVIKTNHIVDFVTFNGTLDVHSKESNQVFDLAETKDGTLLAATYKGVYSIKNNKIKLLTKKNGLASNFIRCILIAKDNKIILGSHNVGLDIYFNGNYHNYSTENGLSDNSITDLHELSDGKILIGTQNGGLNIFSDNRIDTINVDKGLLSNEIRAAAEDKLGNIIVTTPKGINIITRQNDSFYIRSLTEQDGLAGNDCNPNALYIDSLNNTYIGTKTGLSKYNSYYDKPAKIPPPTYITGLDIYNKPVDFKIFKFNSKLNFDENYLKFHFIGIDVSAPHKVVYKYRLSNVDKDWVTSKNTDVQYTSLDDGNYTFEVKAATEWGYWSEPAKLSFTILPAWWETWWFYTISVLTVLGLVAFMASYRYRNLLAIEKIRSKISADLHDNIGSGLTEITFLSEMVKHQVNGNEQAGKGLNNITEISKTLIDDMRDIVWLVNPSKDTLKDLFNRLQDSYQEVLKYSNISLVINGINNLENISLPMNYRQHIFLMFKEAINNSIKYSCCKNIEINVKTHNKTLTVDLTDNGIGFDINDTKLGNGIKNIKKRAEAVNGKIEIISKVNGGTKIKFSMKLGKTKLYKL